MYYVSKFLWDREREKFFDFLECVNSFYIEKELSHFLVLVQSVMPIPNAL